MSPFQRVLSAHLESPPQPIASVTSPLIHPLPKGVFNSTWELLIDFLPFVSYLEVGLSSYPFQTSLIDFEHKRMLNNV